jgi:amino acid transporter
MDSRDALDTSETRKSLGLWDATSLIVGIIVGVGIFRTPASVFADTPGFLPAISTWVLGGIISLLGALCFAELASAYPHSGGEYVYLSRAFDRPPLVGFLYAWTQLLLIRPGSNGMVAYMCAFYLGAVLGITDPLSVLALTIAALGILTVINILGVRIGTFVQNLLTTAKILGLAAIILIGFLRAKPTEVTWTGEVSFAPFAGSMVAVLWTYAGWNEAAYVASEVRNPRRNLTVSLILGTALVMVLYLLVATTLAFGLGTTGAKSKTGVADLVGLAWPTGGAVAVGTLIFVSALGALNGSIFTTSRICVAFGTDHAVFSGLARWNPLLKTPVVALVFQFIVTVVLVVGVFVPSLADFGKADDPFDGLLALTSAIFWLTFLLTGVALFVLRFRDRDLPRHFRVPGYPIVPILFILCCGYMVYGSIDYARIPSAIGFGILILGVPIFYLTGHLRRPAPVVRRELDEAIREDVTHGAASGL